MLDPEVEESAREQLVTETRTSIESTGELKNEDTWGVRQLAYEINRKNEADYRIFRFEGPPTLLESLDHTLKITDGVMRFRVFKVDPEDPIIPAPPATSVIMAPTGDDDERRGGRGGRYRD
jgi:small subunit ribosomal protein S6